MEENANTLEERLPAGPRGLQLPGPGLRSAPRGLSCAKGWKVMNLSYRVNDIIKHQHLAHYEHLVYHIYHEHLVYDGEDQ